MKKPTVYVTREGGLWLSVRHPDGLIPPPTIELHKPMEGPVTFYFAECYGLPVPPEALAVPRTVKGDNDATT